MKYLRGNLALSPSHPPITNENTYQKMLKVWWGRVYYQREME